MHNEMEQRAAETQLPEADLLWSHQGPDVQESSSILDRDGSPTSEGQGLRRGAVAAPPAYHLLHLQHGRDFTRNMLLYLVCFFFFYWHGGRQQQVLTKLDDSGSLQNQ